MQGDLLGVRAQERPCGDFGGHGLAARLAGEAGSPAQPPPIGAVVIVRVDLDAVCRGQIGGQAADQGRALDWQGGDLAQW